MSNKTFMIIDSDPDGENYEIHPEIQKAKEAFEERKNNSSFWGEGTIYLIEVKDKKFGFRHNGDIYGAEIIQTHVFEDQ